MNRRYDIGNFLLGLKTLWFIWIDEAFADKVERLIEGKAVPAAGEPVAPAPVAPVEPKKPAPGRSEALTLLSVLQREARFVDFIKEPIASYTDAQIGAAVRSVHQDCGAVLERLFSIQPLRSQTEGAEIEVPEGYDPAEFRLVGNVPDRGPLRGKLTHAGWRATQCEVPAWNGREETALVVASCEVEVK